MEKRKKNKFIFLFLFCCLHCLTAYAQKTYWASGKVEDEDGENAIGAQVTCGSSIVTTDDEGKFQIKIPSSKVKITIRYEGAKTEDFSVNHGNNGILKLTKDAKNTVVITATRSRPRTVIKSTVPIDNITVDALAKTGQFSFDKQLMHTVPSFNSTQQAISDATAHFDPFDLRGLGPSRTLVLINGKRKNSSSLVYINDTPGKGEVGVDMKSIPASAVQRVEVLRDGASPQYGSDAIAGVINVILKNEPKNTTFNAFRSVTKQGDGITYGYDVNAGVSLGTKGHLNLTHSYLNQQHTNRAGAPGTDLLFSKNNDWTKANPQLGCIIGQPDVTLGDVFFNASMPLDSSWEVYSFGGLTYRNSNTYALYRTPYWIKKDFDIYTTNGVYNGFLPTFNAGILDNTLVAGLKGEKNKLKYDVSYSSGSNSVDYQVNQSLNTTMGPITPTQFRVGGYHFNHKVMNLDISKIWKFGQMELEIGSGSEIRIENFKALAGEEASYINAKHPLGYLDEGTGCQSFPGLQPQNEVNAFRNNFGAYLQATIDYKRLTIGGAIRPESYSDFGRTTTWKVDGRYELWKEIIAARGSYSTGFRAPSLHQIHLSNIQTLVSNGKVSNQATFNNESTIIRQLGIPKLKQENAESWTAGLAIRPTTGIYMSFDYYSIRVSDRIVYSSSIKSSVPNSTLDRILTANNITSLKFFINAVSTHTQGLDAVINLDKKIDDDIKMSLNLAFNANWNKIDSIMSPSEVLRLAKVAIFDRKEQSRILFARPDSKLLLNGSIEIGWFGFNANLTRYGKVTWQHIDNGLNKILGKSDTDFDQTFAAKSVIDISLQFKISKHLSFGLLANNVSNVYPDVIDTKGDFVTDLGGRFKYSWEVNQFGYLGRVYSMKLNLKL